METQKQPFISTTIIIRNLTDVIRRNNETMKKKILNVTRDGRMNMLENIVHRNVL